MVQINSIAKFWVQKYLKSKKNVGSRYPQTSIKVTEETEPKENGTGGWVWLVGSCRKKCQFGAQLASLDSQELKSRLCSKLPILVSIVDDLTSHA